MDCRQIEQYRKRTDNTEQAFGTKSKILLEFENTNFDLQGDPETCQ